MVVSMFIFRCLQGGWFGRKVRAHTPITRRPTYGSPTSVVVDDFGKQSYIDKVRTCFNIYNGSSFSYLYSIVRFYH